MKKLALALALLLAWSSAASAAPFPPITILDANNTPIVFCPSTAAVNISSATTTQLVALNATQTVYVCSIVVSLAGTSPTIQFEYGTGASCGTGTTVLSGAMAFTGLAQLVNGGWAPFLRTPVGQALCVVSGGTTPSVQGFITYAQF